MKGLRVVAPRATLTDGELVAGLLRGVLQEHDREAVAALEAFATRTGGESPPKRPPYPSGGRC